MLAHSALAHEANAIQGTGHVIVFVHWADSQRYIDAIMAFPSPGQPPLIPTNENTPSRNFASLYFRKRLYCRKTCIRMRLTFFSPILPSVALESTECGLQDERSSPQEREERR
jgi:hypothetical protein